MSHLWFTADLHFGHANIAKYCGRPFIRPGELTGEGKWASAEAVRAVESRMEEGLVAKWNSRVKPGDTVIHVGDFCNRGFNRGVPGARKDPEEYERRLNGKVVFVYGNHDRNNGVKFAVDTMLMPVGGRLAFIQHRPVEREEEVPPFCELVICGHVHEKWLTKWVGGILCVNVGVDANRMMPVRQDEVIGIFHRELNKLKEEAGVCTTRQ